MKPHEPMLRYIRKNVERPDHLPYSTDWDPLRFKCGKCPMGLLPCAVSPTPFSRIAFNETLPGEFSDLGIADFAMWWDDFEDSKLAVEAIWGKGKP